MKTYKTRDEVEEEYKWDLTSFFKNEEEFNKSLQELENNINQIKNYVGCTKDADKLYEFLNFEINTLALFEDLYVYAHLINDQELGISKNIERKNKTIILNGKLETALSFFNPELLKLSNEEYQSLFTKNPKLNEYKAVLDDIYRFKDHILNEEEDIIVTKLVNAMDHFDDISSTMLNKNHHYGYVTVDGEKVLITSTNFRKLMRNPKQEVRRKVYMAFHKVIDQYSDVNANLLNSYISMEEQLASIYKFSSSWEQKLFSLELSDKVFKTLCETTEKNLDVLHKFYTLKKDVLKLEPFNYYDIALPMSHNKKEYSIKDAQSIIRNSLEPLGKEYLNKFEKIITNRYIDYCEYQGKCSGGYSFGTLKQDSRILLSFNGNLDSVSTIAHEAGHNVHHQFIKENNPLQYLECPNIVCEVASLTNEFLLSNYLAKKGSSKEEKLSGIENILNVIENNLFGAVREGLMEKDMYQVIANDGSLTKEYLDNLSKKSLKKYLGPSVKTNKYIKDGWVTRSHYYMNYYLFSYAICVCVAANVADKIINGDKEMLENYLKFLKTGSDKNPTEIYAILKIDLESAETYKRAIEYFDSLITKFREIYEGDA